jgi:hypothetical protein
MVSYVLDAADRVSSVGGVSSGGNYASFSYKPAGVIDTMTSGNVTQQFGWNDRIQPVGLTATGSGSSLLLSLGLYPCAGGSIKACSSGNNGNLRSQVISFPGRR